MCVANKDNHRKNDNFIRSNVVEIDVDNEHSDNPEDGITVENVKRSFPNAAFYVHYSAIT